MEHASRFLPIACARLREIELGPITHSALSW